jgi:hypothetical protein
MNPLIQLIPWQWMPKVLEHHLGLTVNLIVDTAMASPWGYQRSGLISMESLGGYIQLLEWWTQLKSSKGFGGPGVWPFIVWLLNGLPKLVIAKWQETVSKWFKRGRRDLSSDSTIFMAK